MAPPTEILECPLSRRMDALELVLRDVDPEWRVALVASLPERRGDSLGPFDALMVAMRGNRLVAAAWAQPQPGRYATLWLPQFAIERDVALEKQLIEAATHRAGERGTAMLQAVLEPHQIASARLLVESGFRHVADLSFQAWSPQGDLRPTWSHLQLEFYREQSRDRIKSILARSYVSSLDCPQLNDPRTLDDTLSGYQATGQFDPKLWVMAVDAQQDVGAVLLAPFPQSRQMELLYLGVAPEARRRRIGTTLLSYAQHLASQRRYKKIILAVDAANVPALNLYRNAGFHEWSRRSVYVRSLASST